MSAAQKYQNFVLTLKDSDGHSAPCLRDSFGMKAPSASHAHEGSQTANFLPSKAWIHDLGSTCVFAKDREKHWNDGLVHVF